MTSGPNEVMRGEYFQRKRKLEAICSDCNWSFSLSHPHEEILKAIEDHKKECKGDQNKK